MARRVLLPWPSVCSRIAVRKPITTPCTPRRAASERENGHSNAYFNQLWTPLGAAVGGEQAAIGHFARMHWLLDLNRTWDGGFDWNAIDE